MLAQKFQVLLQLLSQRAGTVKGNVRFRFMVILQRLIAVQDKVPESGDDDDQNSDPSFNRCAIEYPDAKCDRRASMTKP